MQMLKHSSAVPLSPVPARRSNNVEWERGIKGGTEVKEDKMARRPISVTVRRSLVIFTGAVFVL